MSTLVDSSALDRLRDFGGEKLLRGMIDLFVKNAPLKASEAAAALGSGDAAALRSALHALKSSAGQLGASTVHAACAAGEELASRGDVEGCVVHVRRIEEDLPIACQQLEIVRAGAA